MRVRHNFVWAACRDNIHVFAQLAVLLGHVGSNVEAASFDESIIKQFAIGCYRQPISMEAHNSDDKLQGVALYTDKTRCQFKHSTLAFGGGKSFEQRYEDDGKNSRNPNSTSNLSKLYPSTKPIMPEEGGYCGIFDDLNLCIGIDPTANNDCLTRRDNGLFVWTDRTMIKLGESTEGNNIKEKQMRLALQIVQLMYSLMMGNDAIIDGIPLKQYLGPLRLQN